MKVFKCKCLLNNDYYALKEIPKLKLTDYKEIFCHLNEPSILKKLNNYTFIQKIISSFQDFDNLYLVTNYYEGNNLYYYKDDIFTEEQLKFISACIIQFFINLREKNIIHRDIRMNNIIMDKDKYLNLLDFSYAIYYSEKNDFKNYIRGNYFDNAPEIQNFSIYDYNSDYYRLGGSILYYLIFKKYLNKVKIEKNIVEIKINYKNITNYTSSCIDFLNKLITTDHKKRIGYNNIDELRNHSWFNNFDWNNLANKKMKSPLIFKKTNFNQSECNKFDFTSENKIKYKTINKKHIYKKLIENYNYVDYQIINNILNLYKNIS